MGIAVVGLLVGCSGGDDGGSDAKAGADSSVPGTWVSIQAGSFEMGSPSSEPCRGDNEPQHRVTLTRRFEMQSTEVTQAQFREMTGYNPSYFSSCGSKCPVDTVSWSEAVAYCNALSAKSGLTKCYSCSGEHRDVSCKEASSYEGGKIYDCPGYRLPTEAEWEYAYRAGTKTAFYNGPNSSACKGCTKVKNLLEIAWYNANSQAKYSGCLRWACGCVGTHPVKQKKPNAWSLYDMSGNLYEWCNDWYQQKLGTSPVTDPWGPKSGKYRATRGGAWDFEPFALRGASRMGNEKGPHVRGGNLGFRCVRTLR